MTDSPANDAVPQTIAAGEGVRVTCGSRLHFGLIDTVDPFGGVGVMIGQPATEVVLTPGDRFDCPRPAAERLTAIARQVADYARLPDLPACRIDVIRQPPAHCGLGSGTQLAMAAAEAMCRFLGLTPDSSFLATQIASRGQRSAVGVHGYFSGGLIFESGCDDGHLNPIIHRIALPQRWAVGVFRPTRDRRPISGQLERRKFDRLSPADSRCRQQLMRIVSQRMVPAARQEDFVAFSDSVQQYNLASGRLFQRVQGGPYNGQSITALIDWLVAHGGKGVGQSSWGPGVFAWFPSRQLLEAITGQLPPQVSLIAATTVRNQPRTLRPACPRDSDHLKSWGLLPEPRR